MITRYTWSRLFSVFRGSASALNFHTSPYRHSESHRLSVFLSRRSIQTSTKLLEKNDLSSSVVVYAFEHVNKKEKEAFLDVLHIYETHQTARRGHVEFILSAMSYMEEFGVHEDLEVYKKLVDIMPKGRFISSTPMAADFMHFPKQQQCIIDLLEQMECNGVIPDYEMQQMLLNIFGQFGIPLRKFWRMMYWMPKFKNLNPWPTPRPVPTDAMILAQIAVDKMSSVDVQTELTVFQTDTVKDAIDKTWIISAMSPEQQELLEKHPVDEAIYVEGPYKVWVADKPVDYFILRAEPTVLPKEYIDEDDVTKFTPVFWDKPHALGRLRSIHQEEDATIFSICATGTSSKDSLLSWIRCLQRKNPILEKIPVLFTLTKQISDEKLIEDGSKENEAPLNKIDDK